VNPLLKPPDTPERQLLKIVLEGHQQAGQWPVFQYVESLLYRFGGADATTVLAELPRVQYGVGRGSYGWVTCEDLGVTPRDDTTVALTVAGQYVVGNEAVVHSYLRLLAIMVEKESEFEPSPTEVRRATLSSSELRVALDRSARAGLVADELIERAPGLIRGEPATWGCAVPFDGTDVWTATLHRSLRHYAGIDVYQPEQYLERVFTQLHSPGPPAPLFVSSLGLPEAIDYLNAIWRVHAGTPLFEVGRVEAAAKLALDCAAVEEFESRLSSLCLVMDRLRLPGEDGYMKLVHLREYLNTHLPAASFERCEAAISDLQCLYGIRAWRQHSTSSDDWRRSAKQLGVELPTADWSVAWSTIRSGTIQGLATLREESEFLIESDG